MPSRPRDTQSVLPIVVEPLTPKELEVLGHLAKFLTTEEIAQVMFVSVNTVRTHIRKILRSSASTGATRPSAGHASSA